VNAIEPATVLPAIDQELKALGLRLTPQRSHILAVLKAAERPISAYDIYSQLKSTFPHISIDTVYRNLTMFTTIGVALQINLQNAASALFEYQGERHHHHAVCIRCGKNVCVEACPGVPEVKYPEGEQGFQVTGHAFELYGFCAECQRQGTYPARQRTDRGRKNGQ
jgi:Fe2+ or Zn2+ uptake regulation protein